MHWGGVRPVSISSPGLVSAPESYGAVLRPRCPVPDLPEPHPEDTTSTGNWEFMLQVAIHYNDHLLGNCFNSFHVIWPRDPYKELLPCWPHTTHFLFINSSSSSLNMTFFLKNIKVLKGLDLKCIFNTFAVMWPGDSISNKKVCLIFPV